MKNLARAHEGLRQLATLKAVDNPLPQVSTEIRDLVHDLPMNLYIKCPHGTADAEYWRQALAQIGGKFNFADLTWDITLNPNSMPSLTLVDIIHELSIKGVVAQILPCFNKTKFDDFVFDSHEWKGMGKVLLSTSYSEKDDLKKMFPSATWNDVIKSWHVPLELAIAVRGSGNDIIEQNGWFDGVVGNIGEFPCQVLPHKLIMPAVSTHGLYHEGYKSSVVMSVHTNCLVPTEKIIYISYLRHANDDASEIVQFRGSVGRKIWDAVVKCGFSTNPNMTHTHVSAHKGSLIGSHPPVGKVTPTNLSKFPSTNKTTDYALQA